MKKIVMLGGQSGAGKSYLAQRITEEFPSYTRVSIAYELKNFIFKLAKVVYPHIQEHNLFGTQEEKLFPFNCYCTEAIVEAIKTFYILMEDYYPITYTEAQKTKIDVALMSLFHEKDVTGRRLMRIIGTEIMRKLIEDTIHIKKFTNFIHNHPNEYFVLDDYRFLNEFAFLNYYFMILPLYLHKVDDDSHVSEKCDFYYFKRYDVSKEYAPEQEILDMVADFNINFQEYKVGLQS